MLVIIIRLSCYLVITEVFCDSADSDQIDVAAILETGLSMLVEDRRNRLTVVYSIDTVRGKKRKVKRIRQG